MEIKCVKCGTPIGPNDECFVGESGPLCKTCLNCGMVYHALKALGLVQPAKFAPRATDIQWDVDDPDDLETLPSEVLLPRHVVQDHKDCYDEVISNYLSDITGYCHRGYALEEPVPAILVELDYKGSYQRFALTPEEFKERYPGTYAIFGPITECNSDTLKPMVHIYFSPCVVNDDKWTAFFSDSKFTGNKTGTKRKKAPKGGCGRQAGRNAKKIIVYAPIFRKKELTIPQEGI